MWADNGPFGLALMALRWPTRQSKRPMENVSTFQPAKDRPLAVVFDA